MTRIQFNKMFATSMPAVMRASPEYQALEKKYPGIIDHVLSRMRPTLGEYSIARMPLLLGRIADIYDTNLTETELRQVLAFYRSPTGIWLIGVIASGSDVSAIFQRGMQNPDSAIDGGDIRAATSGAALPSVIAGMTPERMNEIVAFSVTPAGRKVKAIGSQSAAVAAAWANEKDPRVEAAMLKVVIDARREYIAKIDSAAPGSRS
ncbi:DUF2059 domain-containing protein [Sphingomonas sp. RT2P30]|uniref:DUF2059 domain-containing protein n=1 Tax=Parasphingomonas halimpatiens TaxID=3096162 RepID=UPI002FC74B5B